MTGLVAHSLSNDPVVPLYCRWERLMSDDHGNSSDVEVGAVAEELAELEREIARTPALTVRGQVAKARLIRHQAVNGAPYDDSDEAMIDSLIADLEMCVLEGCP